LKTKKPFSIVQSELLGIASPLTNLNFFPIRKFFSFLSKTKFSRSESMTDLGLYAVMKTQRGILRQKTMREFFWAHRVSTEKSRALDLKYIL
jgi:hypothetical protein